MNFTEKERRENAQLVSSVESFDWWKTLCLKSGAQYKFREKFEPTCSSDTGINYAFLLCWNIVEYGFVGDTKS